jgi:hypothetical protein
VKRRKIHWRLAQTPYNDFAIIVTFVWICRAEDFVGAARAFATCHSNPK